MSNNSKKSRVYFIILAVLFLGGIGQAIDNGSVSQNKAVRHFENENGNRFTGTAIGSAVAITVGHGLSNERKGGVTDIDTNRKSIAAFFYPNIVGREDLYRAMMRKDLLVF